MARILVVDDQASVRQFIRNILEKAGHVVVEAANGRKAVDALQSVFDLVITDVLMPEMDGLEFVERLKSAGNDVPILVMSGGWRDTGVDLLSIAKRLGANRILRKEDVRDALLGTVADMLASRAARLPPAALRGPNGAAR